MKASNLHELWSSPDNSRISSKQYSFRLPVHVAAKIEALCEMYPNKNRTQIVGDLLASALEEVVKGFPSVQGQEIAELPDGEIVYEDAGPSAQFWKLADKYYVQMERELGNDKPGSIRSTHASRAED